MRVEPVVRSDAEKAASKAPAATKKAQSPCTKRRPGRPKGSQNQPTADVTFTPELSRITAMLDAVLHVMAGLIPLTSRVLAGPFGPHHALHLAQQSHLPRSSKRRYEAALDCPYTGPYAGRGPRRKYGRKVDDTNLPERYLKETAGEGHLQTRLYQALRLHKEFEQPLHVVIRAKTNLRTQARAHVVLGSSDLALASAPRVDY